jgi:2-methylcitrate dehydratase
VAYHIIGGGEEGDKHAFRTKEEADHSLPYLLAVALLDGEVSPAQYTPERILGEDVQALLRLVAVRPDAELSRRFPREMPCRLSISLREGRILHCEKADYEGFLTRPMRWETAVAKFERLAAPYTDQGLRRALVEAVSQLDTIAVRDLAASLAAVHGHALDAAGEPFDTAYVHGAHWRTATAGKDTRG